MWETRISEKAEQMKNEIFFDKWSIVFVIPPYGKDQKVEKCQIINFDECPENIFDAPCSTSGI